MSETTPSEPREVRARPKFPGLGTAERLDMSAPEHLKITHLDSGLVHKLGEWRSTAICGNDITSSCLYVAALSALYAGPYSPFALAAVAGVLYLFRGVYAEVGTALPLNGGAYNALLNTTTKAKASVAACLTLLSYLATAVISANEATHYGQNLWGGLNTFDATIVLLGIFAVLTVIGIGESSLVALVLFVFHIATLILLSLIAGAVVLQDTSVFAANWQIPAPGGMWKAVFFGFSAAMLGISGFESSANFIEEQEDGVFPKTLRNMWIAVAIFNPLISVLAMGLLPLGQIMASRHDLLAEMGLLSAGRWLQLLVSVDAALVLSGAVLTSYVGVTGLVRRMALDRCLPQVLLQENKWRGTNHWIILSFFVLCCSILVITSGKIETLAGVYTLSFLGVMMLFAIGNMLLKVKRDRLPRTVRVGWLTVLLALSAVCLAIVGNLMLNPEYVRIFGIYFAVALAIVGAMFLRVQILKVVLAVLRRALERSHTTNRRLVRWILRWIDQINSQGIIFFTRGDNLVTLNRAALYVLKNEQAHRLRVIHCHEREEDIPPDLAEQIRTIDRIYPELRIDLLLVKGRFGPQLIEHLSRQLKVPKNYMFIGTPGDRFPHRLGDLGGVRLIM